MVHLSEEQVRWFRLRRSGLATPFPTPEAAAKSLAGVQAQILPASLLALWKRPAEGAATAAELVSKLFETRTLVRLWGQRHTLHLYAIEDWPMVHASFAQRRTWWERQARIDPALDLAAFRKGVASAGKLLRERGTLSRKELRASGLPMPPELYSPWGGVFAELVREGIACHARWEGGEARYAHREYWVPDLAWSPPTAADATLELARRFFACYGPATLADFAYWRSGAVMGHSREAFGRMADELVEVKIGDEASGRAATFALRHDMEELRAAPPEREAWPVRMLGRFDPLLLAHKVKDWVVPREVYARVWRPAGHIEGIVLEHGRALATWRYDRIGAGGLAVRVYPFKASLPMHVGKEIRRQAKELARFFGLKAAPVQIVRATPGSPP